VHLQKQTILHLQEAPEESVEYLFFGQFPDRARVAGIPKQISTELATTLFQETVASQSVHTNMTTHSPKKQISVAFLGECFSSPKKGEYIPFSEN
jgi:hypothetical protein